jgi:adenylate cyclase
VPEANPPSNRQRWLRRFGFALYTLFLSWWRHRVSFLISVAVTVAALSLYYFTFLGDRTTPIFEFLKRLEYDALDTRFRSRPSDSTPIDSRIVLVDIDQRSQEVLGKWPFARSHFARMLDVLKEDGAKVAAFDITFSKPDQTAAPIRALWADLDARKKRGEKIDPKLAAEVQNLAAEYDADQQFAVAVKNFGAVVLGNFFLHTEADLRGLDDKTLDTYANQIAFYSFPSVRPLNPATGKQDRVRLIENFQPDNLLPRGTEANLEILTSALSDETSSTGFFNVYPDVDGVVRTSNLIIPYGRSQDFKDWDIYASLDVQTMRSYFRLPNEQVVLEYDPVGAVRIAFGQSAQIRTDHLGRVLINYHGPAYTYPHHSLADVVERKVPAAAFRDKIVLVGATATGIGDLRTTPYGGLNYPGVEIHANILDNILHQNFLMRGARQQLWDGVLILAFGIPLGIWMALVSPRWMWSGVALIVPLVAVDYFAFLRGWWLNFTVPAMTLASNVLLVSLYRALIEEKEKRRVRTAFGQYLSPEVIRRLLLNPQLVEPKKTEISVMFSDIRGFTTISEKLDAQELALFLNQYLSDMTRLVFENHGTLDKYIGDAVMAFWGAPFEEAGHATRACNTALKMMERVREMQKKWEAEGKPHLDIGIGLNTGVASVGNMGSALRYGYTALGDSVNLSSRLEGLNKDYGTHILANETTFAYVNADGFVFRELDLIRVKGKLQPVILYELIGRAGEGSSYGSPEEVQVRVDLFAKARDMYRRRQWEQAQQAFQSLLDKWPDDGPSRMYWKRCQEYLFDEPPSGWDGVFTMTHK